MRTGIAFALLVLACSIGSYSFPAFAQHHGSKATAQKPKTDADLIASAMSAGPSAISKDATVVAVGSDGNDVHPIDAVDDEEIVRLTGAR